MWIVIKTHPEPESLWSRVMLEQPIFAGGIGPFPTQLDAEKYACAQEQTDEDHLYDVVEVKSVPDYTNNQ